MDGLFDELEKQKNSHLTDLDKIKVLEKLDLPKSKNGFYMDAFGKEVSYNGIATLKRQYVKLPLNDYHIKEIKRCKDDIFYFVKNYCKILTKSGISFPEFRQYQIDFIQTLIKGTDVVGSLPRQSGKSVSCGLYLLWRSLFTKNINIGIAANKLNLAMEVLDKIKKIFIELPIWLQQGVVAWNKTFIEFENGTRIMTSATNSDAFRGYSCHLLLIDECGFVSTKLWYELEDSLFPSQDALAQKQKILISTPNGMNHWYHIVENAKKNNSYSYFTMDWRDVPRYNKDGTLKNPDSFKDEIISKHGYQHFAQNYALEFLGSSKTLINSNTLKSINVLDEKEVILDSIFKGLRIFREPQRGHSYLLGIDPKKEGVDCLGIQVLDVTKIPFIQVASFSGDISYLNAPSRIFDLGTYYNDAMIIVENNIDNSIVDTLFYQYDYSGEIYKETNKKILGFRTTIKTKKILLSLLKKLIEESKLLIYDRFTFDEFLVFVEKENGTFSAEDGFHDDLVMSLMISLAPLIDIKNFDDFNGFVSLLESKREIEEAEAEEFSKFFLGMSFSTELNDSNLGEVNKENLDLYSY